MNYSGQEVHLMVLVHGFWGKPVHLYSIRDEMRKRFPDMDVFTPKTFAGNLTYDGVEVCGDRVVQEIYSRIEEHELSGKVVRKFSIGGYSLGGLIARYVVGELFSSGFFEKVEPKNFTTFATPHLGTCTTDDSIRTRLFNIFGRSLLSQTGRDLFIGDGGILPELADPNLDYYKGLQIFQRISLYANVTNDRTVPFFTSFITKYNPFDDLSRNQPLYLQDYSPVIIDLGKTLKRLQKPNPRAWGRRDYIFVIVLAIFGPLIIVGAVATITISAQLSERRVRLMKLSERRKSAVTSALNFTDRPLARIRGAIKSNDEGISSFSQEIVEDMLDRDLPLTVGSRSRFASNETRDVDSLCHEQESLLDTHVLKAERFRSEMEDRHSSVDLEASFDVSHIRTLGAFESLQLSSEQETMNSHLNRLNWHKYAVQIHKTFHSHAAIVARQNSATLSEGLTVIRHFCDRLLL
ncbi:putative serine esterase-domain-containing protein [Dipodascopsis tothii]|uniref:putative serine esterase-domain-containing protein n=1 Tax=Dipodascopsis tothii TaxID=44089 RepID=UPI0034CFC252